MMRVANEILVEDTEVRLLLEGLHQCYGFDFREYAVGPVKQRIWERVREEGVQTISGLQEKVLHDPDCLERLLSALVPKMPPMFDDPPFYTALRTAVVPLLRTYPFLDVWLPACSSGEEAYATAIVLHEEGLLPRVRLYATDLSEAVFRNAKEGVFPLSGMAAHAANYRAAGGIGMLSDYYAIDGDAAVMRPALKDAILFSEHSLATDGCFHEFHMIVCRRILWLFNDWLRARVQTLFQQSLSRFGILGLGQPESFTWKEPEARFDRLGHGWYRRMGVPLEA